MALQVVLHLTSIGTCWRLGSMAKTTTFRLKIRGHRHQVGGDHSPPACCCLRVDVESICSIVEGHYFYYQSTVSLSTFLFRWLSGLFTPFVLQQQQTVQLKHHILLSLPGMSFHFLFSMLNILWGELVHKRHLRSQCRRFQPKFYLHLRCHQE